MIRGIACLVTQYADNEDVPVWLNQLGPYHNPQETYSYYTLPFCEPDRKLRLQPSKSMPNLGELMSGADYVNSGILIQYKTSKGLFLRTFLLLRGLAMIIVKFGSLHPDKHPDLGANATPNATTSLSFHTLLQQMIDPTTEQESTRLCDKVLTAADAEQFERAVSTSTRESTKMLPCVLCTCTS